MSSTDEKRRYTVIENEGSRAFRKRLKKLGRRREHALAAVSRIDEEIREAAVETVSAGALTISEIALLLGAARSTIYEWIGDRQ